MIGRLRKAGHGARFYREEPNEPGRKRRSDHGMSGQERVLPRNCTMAQTGGLHESVPPSMGGGTAHGRQHLRPLPQASCCWLHAAP
jgi:hypothetical protein